MSKLLGIVDVYQSADDTMSIGIRAATAGALIRPMNWTISGGDVFRRRLRVHVKAKRKEPRLLPAVDPGLRRDDGAERSRA